MALLQMSGPFVTPTTLFFSHDQDDTRTTIRFLSLARPLVTGTTSGNTLARPTCHSHDLIMCTRTTISHSHALPYNVHSHDHKSLARPIKSCKILSLARPNIIWSLARPNNFLSLARPNEILSLARPSEILSLARPNEFTRFLRAS